MESGNCLFTFCPDHFSSLVFSPNSVFVASWFSACYAQVWNIHTHSLVKEVRLDVEGSLINVALSLCGGRLVCQSSSHIILWDLGSENHLAHLDFDSVWPKLQIAFAVDGTSIFVHTGDIIIQCWHISPTHLSNHHDDPFYNSNRSTSLLLRLVSIPTQENLSDSVPRHYCHYEGDEWILDEDGKHILWLPPVRRGQASTSKYHGKKIAVGTKPNRRVYLF
jgi:hypothetical protein